MATTRNTWQFWALCFLLVLNAILWDCVLGHDDFYELLNIGRDADTSAIKKAFRKKSLEYHPDKNPGDEEAAEKFTRINRALEVLTDDVKRQIYDQQGEDEVERYERGGNNRRKGPENKIEARVTLEEFYNGAQQEFTVRRNVYCTTCKGSGAEGAKTITCPKCKGQGQVRVTQNMGFMQIQTQQPCDKCKGTGRTNEKNCKVCKGKKVVIEPKTLQLNVEKGMANGEKIIFERQGEQVPDMLQGDIVMVLKQQPHSVFKRVQNNLYMNMDISLKEALFGYEKTIAHLDGHTVQLHSQFNKVTQPFSWNIVNGEGMPIKNRDTFGDLHAKLLVQFPTKLTPRQKELIELIFPDEPETVEVTQ